MAMTLRLSDQDDALLTRIAQDMGVSKQEAVRQAIRRFTPADDAGPTTADWLAAADYVGKRDRELLDRLAQ